MGSLSQCTTGEMEANQFKEGSDPETLVQALGGHPDLGPKHEAMAQAVHGRPVQGTKPKDLA